MELVLNRLASEKKKKKRKKDFVIKKIDFPGCEIRLLKAVLVEDQFHIITLQRVGGMGVNVPSCL